MEIPRTIPEQIADLYEKHSDLSRRFANQDIGGLVTDVDDTVGKVRVELGTDPRTGTPFKSPWMDVEEVAMGGVRFSFLPRIGEQVRVKSPTGDLTDARVGLSIATNSNNRPQAKAGDGAIEADGDVRVDIKAGLLQLAVGGNVFKLSAAGLEYTGPFKVTGDGTVVGNITQTGVHTDSNGVHA